MDLKTQLTNLAIRAQEASRCLGGLSTEEKDGILRKMALGLISRREFILQANKVDVAKAKHSRLPQALIERLVLDDKRLKGMADSFCEISQLRDPVGEVLSAWRVPSGLWIHKVRVPIGVIAIIYESRPNVTSDCVGLCFKSGNAVILRGGSDAINSNKAIFEALSGALCEHGLPEGMVTLVTSPDRRAIDYLLKLDKYIDLVMPRGGEGLIRKVVENSTIPVIKHYKGVCHVYVDEWADLAMANNICFNAKVQRPGVCNAMESMLVHKNIAKKFLPAMIKKFKAAKVKINGCPVTGKIVKGVSLATEKDYSTEYLGLTLSVKVVDSLTEAVNHINIYGTRHSDAIVTENYDNGVNFLRNVDSACCYVNASTRFTDGGQFGMGAEIGISTDKLHARGPVGLEELTTYKYMIFGNGQIRK